MTSQRRILTDALLAEALRRRAGHADDRLLPDILASTEAMAQRRGWFLSVVPRRWLLLGAIAMLLVALLGALAIGSGLVKPPRLPMLQYHHNGEITIGVGSALVGIDSATGLSHVVADCPQLCQQSSSPDWSPDGSRFAYLAQSNLWLVDAGSGRARQLWSLPGANSGAVAWSPDGSSIAVTLYRNAQAAAYLIDVESGQARQPPGDWTATRDLSWSPSGTRFAVIQRSGLSIMNRDGTGAVEIVTTDPWEVAWSPDGRRIAYTVDVLGPPGTQGDPYVLQIWTVDPDGANAVKVFDMPGCCIGVSPGFTWSPDGTKFAVTGPDGLWVVNADGLDPRNFPSSSGSRPAWRPVP